MSIHPNNPKRPYTHWVNKLQFQAAAGNEKAKKRLEEFRAFASANMKKNRRKPNDAAPNVP